VTAEFDTRAFASIINNGKSIGLYRACCIFSLFPIPHSLRLRRSLLMVSSPPSSTIKSDRSTELAERGWRIVTEIQADGRMDRIYVPLTSEEFLHPQEGFHLPNSTFHDDVTSHARDILTRRYANEPTVGVFRDLLIEWDIPGQKDLCPDTFVAFGISNKEQNRSKFIVANEGVRPAFVLEVVSPRYRKEDREIKVVKYALTRVKEYVIVDRRRQRGKWVEEVLGYRLSEGIYQPIAPDEEGRIYCETVGLLMSLQSGCLVIEDANTGERLLSSLELEATNQELEATNQELETTNQELETTNQELETTNQELETTNQELETTNQELETAKELAQQQAAEMAALLEHYRERFGNLPD